MSKKPKNKWQIILTEKDIFLDPPPTKEEIIDLISMAIPFHEILRELIIAAAGIAKTILNKKSTSSWKIEIRDAIHAIRVLNTRRSSSIYFDREELGQMLAAKWNTVLARVVQETDWTMAALKKEKSLSHALVWERMKKMGLDKRLTLP